MGEPQKIHTVVISTQHAEPSKAVRSKECAGYKGPEMTAPSMIEMNKLIVEKVIKATLEEIKLKNRSAAYICRQMAKSVVKSGLAKRALVQLSYAIGVAKPL